MFTEYQLHKLSYFTLKQSNEPVFWIEESGTIIHINPAASKLSGFNYDEIVGKKIYDIHPDEDEQVWLKRWQNLLKHRVLTFEKSQPLKSGEFIHIKVTQNLIEFEGKAYSVSLVEDKTEEYAMRHKIKESERKLSTLMGNLPGMAYRCLFENNWTMEFVSEGCKPLTGYLPSELEYN